MPGKRILALEFSNFSGEGSVLRAFGARRVCPFSEVASRNPGSALVKVILDNRPQTKSVLFFLFLL
jgi:hypothetical protein